ncbi:MAG: energy transducer TonB [Bacteroidales bacterium]|nr:energy transducer TonB [Bacteroidales bacterium]
MTAKRKHRSTQEYLKYLKGELSPGDRYSFERDLEADPFEKEALEGMEQVSDRELEEDLLSLHAGLQKRLSRRRRRTWYYVAASVASLLIVGTVFLNIYEFDPETAPESLPGDQIYLQEDASADRETPAPETAEAEEAESDMGLIQEEARVPEEETIVEKTGLERDVSTRRIRQTKIAERNEPVVAEAEPVLAKAAGATDPAEIAPEDKGPGKRALDKKAVEEMAIEDQAPEVRAPEVKALEVKALEVKALEVEARTPAPVAGEVGVEAQPDLAVSDEVVVIGYEGGKPADPGDKAKQVRLESKEYTSQRAEPEGGLESFKMYIEEQIRFPAGDTLSKREVVVLRFNVARDGSISGIQTLRSPGSMYTEEAIRLLQEGPLWNPARNESGTTDEKVRMRIVFER